MREDTKLARIRQAMREGNWDEALRLAARYRRLGEHAEVIRRAANALASPGIYQELGYDLAQLRADGIAALKERYSKSWEQAQEGEAAPGE